MIIAYTMTQQYSYRDFCERTVNTVCRVSVR